MYFLIKSTLVFSSENPDVCVSVRMGVSSGKIAFDGRYVSFGKLLSNFFHYVVYFRVYCLYWVHVVGRFHCF